MHPDLQIVDVVVAVFLYVLDVVDLQVASPIEHHRSSLEILSKVSEKLSYEKSTSRL